MARIRWIGPHNGSNSIVYFSLIVFLCCISSIHAFLPGETPTLYKEGQVVEIQVGHVESQEALLTIPFYDAIPICKPRKLNVLAQTASDIFNPRWQQASLFRMHMKENQKCKVLCQRTYTTAQLRALAAMIEGGYRANFLVDSMPALMEEKHDDSQPSPPSEASKVNTSSPAKMHYGVPLGEKVTILHTSEQSIQEVDSLASVRTEHALSKFASRSPLALEEEDTQSSPTWLDQSTALATRISIPVITDLQLLHAQRIQKQPITKVTMSEATADVFENDNQNQQAEAHAEESAESSPKASVGLIQKESKPDAAPASLINEKASDQTGRVVVDTPIDNTLLASSEQTSLLPALSDYIPSWLNAFSGFISSSTITPSLLLGDTVDSSPVQVNNDEMTKLNSSFSIESLASAADVLLSMSSRMTNLMNSPLPPNTKYYLNNHIRFLIRYSEEKEEPDSSVSHFGIVSVEAYPLSIKHRVVVSAQLVSSLDLDKEFEKEVEEVKDAEESFTEEDSPEHIELPDEVLDTNEAAIENGNVTNAGLKVSKNTYSPISRAKKHPPVLEACLPPGPLSSSPAPAKSTGSEIEPLLIWDTAYEAHIAKSLDAVGKFIQNTSDSKSSFAWATATSPIEPILDTLYKDTQFPTNSSGMDPNSPFARLDGMHEVVWTYDVRFEPSPLRATARWGLYGALDLPTNVHWMRFYTSLSLVFALTVIVGILFRRAYLRDVLWKHRHVENSSVQRALARASAAVTASALRKHNNSRRQLPNGLEIDSSSDIDKTGSKTTSGSESRELSGDDRSPQSLDLDVDAFETVEKALEAEAEADVDSDGVFNQLFAEMYTVHGKSPKITSFHSSTRIHTNISSPSTSIGNTHQNISLTIDSPVNKDAEESERESDSDVSSPVIVHAASPIRPLLPNKSHFGFKKSYSTSSTCGFCCGFIASAILRCIAFPLSILSSFIILLSKLCCIQAVKGALLRCSESQERGAKWLRMRANWYVWQKQVPYDFDSDGIELQTTEESKTSKLDSSDMDELIKSAIEANNKELVDGWRNIAGDVFRTPPHSELLAVATGSGIQLLALLTTMLLAAVVGIAVPSSRPKVITAVLFLFVMASALGGYITTQLVIFFDTPRPKSMRILKQMQIEEQLAKQTTDTSKQVSKTLNSSVSHTSFIPQVQYNVRYAKLAALTSVIFPVLIMLMLGIMYLLVSFTNTSSKQISIPPTLIHIAILWLLVALPLGQLGCYQSIRRPLYRVPPVPVHAVARRIPRLVTLSEEKSLVIKRIQRRKAENEKSTKQFSTKDTYAEYPVRRWKWYKDYRFIWLIGALFTFAPCVVELRYIMHCALLHQYYSAFGFAFVLCVILLVTTAEASAMTSYFLLSIEDYRWWWRSFKICGSSAGFLMLLAIMHFLRFRETASFVAGALYFAFVSILGMTFFFITGAIGFLSSFVLVHLAYSRTNA